MSNYSSYVNKVNSLTENIRDAICEYIDENGNIEIKHRIGDTNVVNNKMLSDLYICGGYSHSCYPIEVFCNSPYYMAKFHDTVTGDTHIFDLDTLGIDTLMSIFAMIELMEKLEYDIRFQVQ